MSIEAMLSLPALFFLLGLSLETASEQLVQTQKAMEEFMAIAEAKKCSLLVDSVFSNSGGMPETKSANCFQEEKGSISAKINNSKAKATILAQDIFSGTEKENAMIEVKTNEHYK